MGRKQDTKRKQQQQVEQSVEQSVQQQQQDQIQDNFQDDFQDQLNQDQQMADDSVLLKKIQDKILDCNEDEKLAWGAIYSIKNKQAKLNEQMQNQIQKIKEKYQKLRLPFMNQIADVVSGKQLDKQLYSECEFTKNINLTKTKPKALRQYWGKVFQSCGLVGNQDDIDLLQDLSSFKCELIDVKNQGIKIVMEFDANQFVQGNIEIKVQGKVSQSTFKKSITFKGKKGGKTFDENSLFGLLTSESSDDQQLQDTCHDLYRAYISSVYFYFFEVQEGEQFPGQQGSEDQDNQGQQQDEDDEQDVKPVKKAKGSAITEKPQCKNQ